jgi:hypothetical protein
MGLNSKMLPSLFSLLKKKRITLLSHPILNEEVRKHIRFSPLIEKLSHLKTAITKYKSILPLVNISAEKTIVDIDSLKLEDKMIQAYEDFHLSAIRLPYPNAELIFTQYFTSQAPFSEKGDKKHEFPDAFVIEAIKQYLSTQSTLSVLVISDDTDWEKALSTVPRASIVNSISQGMKILQNSENILPIYHAVKEDIKKAILVNAECECYELDIFDEVEDLEITEVKIIELNDDIIPLKISEESTLLRVYATIQLSGRAVVLDDSRSYWDKEDGYYMFVAYSDISFEKGISEIECEVLITHNLEGFEDSVCVESSKINVEYNIEIELDENDIIYADYESDALADAMDALEEYHHH